MPRVDGARTPPKARSIAPCRSRSASSMESAPAHIAASSDITFAAGWAPPLLSAPSMRSRGDQLGQADPLGQADQRQQPGVRDQVRLVEHGGNRCGGMAGLHLADASRSDDVVL